MRYMSWEEVNRVKKTNIKHVEPFRGVRSPSSTIFGLVGDRGISNIVARI